jgi:hypothetical protein
MCVTGAGMMRRPRGDLTEATFRRLLSELAARQTPVRFIRWGEPLLHERLVWMIASLSSAGCITHVGTNGSLLTDDMVRRLIAAGLKSIKISFQGTDTESYEETRRGLYFEFLLSRLESLHRTRGQLQYPYIAVTTTITDEAPERVDRFKDLVSRYADSCMVGATNFDLARDAEMQARQTERNRAAFCPEVFDKLSVDWDGTATLCCRDWDRELAIGSVNEESLGELWRSPRAAAVRSAVASGAERAGYALCRTCYDYLGLTRATDGRSVR